MTRSLGEGAIGAKRAVLADIKDVRAFGDIFLHAQFTAEAVHRLDPAAFDRRDQRRMRVEYHMGTDLAFQPQLLAVGGQQQLNGSGEEANAVVNALNAVFGIDTFQRHHCHQHMGVGNKPRIAGKKRLDVERARRFNHRIYPVAGDINARHFIDNLVDLRDHNPLAEMGGFGNNRRIFGVKAGVEIAVFIRFKGGD